MKTKINKDYVSVTKRQAVDEEDDAYSELQDILKSARSVSDIRIEDYPPGTNFKQELCYKVICKCLRGSMPSKILGAKPADEIYANGQVFTEQEVPAMVKSEAKTMQQYEEIWRTRIEELIEKARKDAYLFASDGFMLARLNQNIVENKKLLRRRFELTSNHEDFITDEQILEELAAAVLITYRLVPIPAKAK